eukprot:TRINITY_DN4740_c0_g1_i1.p1 TRINITY_DN4740_c0_g1~~TRINITY_DN4740_c0_g1_i1.p1  ORF type:complete len:800 (-),score=97.37 TRINITY_DN4740_c0_g1_i1:154-2364(-)
MSHVQKFLEGLHKDHYRVYNLCSERDYDSGNFANRVARYPFDDHNPPPLDLMEEFCEDAKSWLESDPENVCVVHCKAGKGRTGTMIACLLLHMNKAQYYLEALNKFAKCRSTVDSGVTIPSQRRYVQYYHTLLTWKKTPKGLWYHLYPKVYYSLKAIRLYTLPTFNVFRTCEPYATISRLKKIVYFSNDNAVKKGEILEFDCNNLLVFGDVKIEFYNRQLVGGKMFWFWFNTAFLNSRSSFNTAAGLVEGAIQGTHPAGVPEDSVLFEQSTDGNEVSLILRKHELDKACKDTQHKYFSPKFCVKLIFKVHNFDSAPVSNGSLPHPSSSTSTVKQDQFNSVIVGKCLKCEMIVTLGETLICGEDQALPKGQQRFFYHLDCAKCSQCGKLPRGDAIMIKDGNPVCPSCQPDFFPHCTKCGGIITSGQFSRFHSQPRIIYHPQCLPDRADGDEEELYEDESEDDEEGSYYGDADPDDPFTSAPPSFNITTSLGSDSGIFSDPPALAFDSPATQTPIFPPTPPSGDVILALPHDNRSSLPQPPPPPLPTPPLNPSSTSTGSPSSVHGGPLRELTLSPREALLSSSDNILSRHRTQDKKESLGQGRYTCFECNQDIVRGSTFFRSLKDRFYHTDCFRCCVCETLFSDGDPYFVYENKLHCRPHYLKMVAPACSICKLKLDVNSDYYSCREMDKHFHQHCFFCTKCTKPFVDGRFMTYEDQIVCRSCRRKMLRQKASGSRLG